MSGSRRDILRFDYKEYGKTGRKIRLTEENSDDNKLQENMATDAEETAIATEGEMFEEIDECLGENSP